MITIIVTKRTSEGKDRDTKLVISNTLEWLRIEDTDNGSVVFLPKEILTGLIEKGGNSSQG